jgi:hypothetical protein
MRVMRRRIGEWILSVVGLAILLLILLVIYPVPKDVSDRALTKPSAEISSMGRYVRVQTQSFAAVALDQGRAHSELAVFGLAAIVLLGFMLRT